MNNVFIHPILTEETAQFFVHSQNWEPWTHTYDKDDVLERKDHLENYLGLKDIPNLKNLCGAEGSFILTPMCEIDITEFSLDELLVKICIGTELGVFKIKIPEVPANAFKVSPIHSRWHQLNIRGVTKFSDIRNSLTTGAEWHFEEVLGGSDWELKWDVRLYFCRGSQWISIDPRVTLLKDGDDVMAQTEVVGTETINGTVMNYVTGPDAQAFAVGYKLNIPLHSYNFGL